MDIKVERDGQTETSISSYIEGMWTNIEIGRECQT